MSSPAFFFRPTGIALAVAIVVAGVAVVALRGGDDASPAPGTPAPQAASQAPARGTPSLAQDGAVVAMPGPDAAPASAPAPASGAVTRIVRGPQTAARAAFEGARNLGTVFNALHLQSDPEALFFAERALRDCLPYVLAGDAGQPPALDRYRPALPDDPMTARRRTAYTAVAARCSGFDVGGDPWNVLRGLRAALAESNDPRAALAQAAGALRRGGDPAEVMDKVRSVAGGGDPYAIEQASSVMAAMRGRYVFVLDGQVVKPDIVAAGWMMAACDAGRSCGDEWVQAPCAFLTECDARDLESSLQRYQLTPSEYDAMQQVRTRVSRGVATGQWDAELFAPHPAPPLYRRWGP